ncbi:unnamed protein product [Spodoptera littoralis]|uniref:Uncharacterized protein n=1 Tax=Spodoptera littoralis TaxID=7109 RepID=A0A9P0I3S6_SPOLI|nr:unnamed protein product [Spodoptera littoralis]CAH1638928.1 unnamed protein product [Spodoptera littoralis]
MELLPILLLANFIQLASFSHSPCVIELECAECLPDNMPLVTSHRAANGSLRLADGAALQLSCGAGRFLAAPTHAALAAHCRAGRYAALGRLLHLRELGCQQSIFEDVLHQVDDCGNLQGRAYLMHETDGQARHLATACFDADRGVAVRLQTAAAGPAGPVESAEPAHSHASAPRSLLGNFNQMFDAATRQAAERLYSDDVRLNRRLHELLRHDHYTFADQTLTSGKLLSSRYFDDQFMRVTDFVSNKVAVWSSVAKGNLHHLHQDVARFVESRRGQEEVEVLAGTHGVLSLRTDGAGTAGTRTDGAGTAGARTDGAGTAGARTEGAGTAGARTELYLMAGERFPVPRYVWTVVHARRSRRAVALVVLNDPFVAVSEIRAAVFCASACSEVGWLRALRAQRRYESAVYGLVFCCSLRDLAAHVAGLPARLATDMPLLT